MVLTAASLAVVVVGCDGASASTQSTSRQRVNIATSKTGVDNPMLTGGGGTGGGGTTPAACSYIRTLDPKPGYYPGNKAWGAIWTTVSIQNCVADIQVYGILSAHLTGETVGYSPRWNVGTTALGTGKTVSPGTIDLEPVLTGSSFDVTLDVFNLMSGALVETRTMTVVTPVAIP
jgi:hypothetical protein